MKITRVSITLINYTVIFIDTSYYSLLDDSSKQTSKDSLKRRLAKIGSFEILYEKKKKAFKQSKSQKAHFSLEMENKTLALKKKTISLDLTNEDTIKSKRKKNMEIVKSELKKLDVIQDESPTEAKNPQLVTLGMFVCLF